MPAQPDTTTVPALRREAFGQGGLSWVDRWGVWLSERAVLKHLPRGAPLSALDLGCGFEARLLRRLAPRLQTGMGIDVRIAEAARNTPPLVFQEGAIEAVLPAVAADTFDVVLLLSVLEHLREPIGVLRESYRVLRPGGVLLVNVPTWLGKRFLEYSAFRLHLSGAVEIEDHKRYCDIRDLWPLLVQAGFKPSGLRLRYHKFGLNLFGVCRK